MTVAYVARYDDFSETECTLQNLWSTIRFETAMTLYRPTVYYLQILQSNRFRLVGLPHFCSVNCASIRRPTSVRKGHFVTSATYLLT